jgi:hypothetical protein
MIVLSAVNQAILDRLKADTGTGGLYQSGAWNLISGAWAAAAPAAATFPYLVWTLNWSAAPSRQADEYELIASFTIYDDASVYVDDSNFANRVSPVMDRIHGDAVLQSGCVPTYGFNRYALTLATNGYTAKASTCLVTEGQMGMLDEKILSVTTNMKFRVTALAANP